MRKIFLLLSLLTFLISNNSTGSTYTRTMQTVSYGLTDGSGSCASGRSSGTSVYADNVIVAITGNPYDNYYYAECSFHAETGSITTNVELVDGYLPTGEYRMVWLVCGDGPCARVKTTSYATSYSHIEGSIPLSQQSLTPTFSYWKGTYGLYDQMSGCLMYQSDAGTYYSASSAQCGKGDIPVPPTPDVKTVCAINNGNSLNIDLDTVERASIVTVPGTGMVTHHQIPIECTSNGSITEIETVMQLKYTPLTVSGEDIIQSSTSGLGVSIIYNGNPLSPADSTPLTLSIGSNSLDLAFQPVRDPSLNIDNISTGNFTASAVLVITQQ